MAQSKVALTLDSGALILAEKNPGVEAIIRKWLLEGSAFFIAAPVLAEVLRGTPNDAIANRLIKTIGTVAPTTETIARDAGALLDGMRNTRTMTVDALVVATAKAHNATDILTTDPEDIGLLSVGLPLNVINVQDVRTATVARKPRRR